MSDDKPTNTQPDPLSDEGLAGYSDGDVIRFEPQQLPSKSGGRPLTVQFEIEVATGKRGEIAALAQTAAIRDVLDWLASRRPGNSDGGQQNNPEC